MTQQRYNTWLLYGLCLLVSTGILLSMPKAGMAGPWSQGQGHFYVKASQGFMFGKEGLIDGKPQGSDFFGASTNLYGEVGLVYGLQVQFFVPYAIYRFTRSETEFHQLDSFLDSIVGLQWTPPFLQKALGIPIAIRFNTKIPLYNQKVLADDPNFGDAIRKSPILGEGQLDFTIWLSAGGAIPNTNLYLFGEAGMRLRSDIFIDERIKGLGLSFLNTFVFNSQAGYFLFKRVLIMLNFNGAIPLGTEVAVVSKGFIGIGLGLYVPIWKGLAVEAGFNHMLWSVAAPPITGFDVGISYKY
jgi:hypothetical protein